MNNCQPDVLKVQEEWECDNMFVSNTANPKFTQLIIVGEPRKPGALSFACGSERCGTWPHPCPPHFLFGYTPAPPHPAPHLPHSPFGCTTFTMPLVRSLPAGFLLEISNVLSSIGATSQLHNILISSETRGCVLISHAPCQIAARRIPA